MESILKCGGIMKISIILFCLLFSFPVLSQDRKILPPGAPKVVVPPHPTEKDVERNLKRKRQYRKKNKIGKPVATPRKKDPPLTEKLQEEAPKLTSLSLRNQVSFFIPGVFVSGDARRDYAFEPGLSYRLEKKIARDSTTEGFDYWYGLRIIPFNGYGTYRNQNARFNFLAFGPSFTLSDIRVEADSSDSKKSSENKEKSKKTATSASKNSKGWLFSFGLSAVSRYVRLPDGGSFEGELETKSIALDPPGIWTEIYYAQIFANTISVEYGGGLHAGESKVFYYISIGMGIWM